MGEITGVELANIVINAVVSVVVGAKFTQQPMNTIAGISAMAALTLLDKHYDWFQSLYDTWSNQDLQLQIALNQMSPTERECMDEAMQIILAKPNDLGPIPDPPTKVDPIILDLTGTGLKTTSITSGTFFDYKSNGFAEETGWINAGEGILVINANSDSNITGQNLLDVQSLSALDSNGDGVIDASDLGWSKIGVFGSNSTGLEGEEFYTLDQLGITSLNLNFESTGTTDSSGNTQVSLGSFTMQDGIIHQMGDYLLQTSTENTIETYSAEQGTA
jgi:hypothetical protein